MGHIDIQLYELSTALHTPRTCVHRVSNTRTHVDHARDTAHRTHLSFLPRVPSSFRSLMTALSRVRNEWLKAL